MIALAKRLVMAAGFVVMVATSPAFVVKFENDNAQRWTLWVPGGWKGEFAEFVDANVVNTNTHAIRYFLASDAYSTTNTAAELDAIRSAFAQWQAIPGTYIKFEEAGLLPPGVDIDVLNNTNLIFFVKTRDNLGRVLVNGGLDDISGTLAATYTSFYDDMTLAEADTVINGSTYRWYTDALDVDNERHLIEGLVLHEIGHILGLDHSPVGGATMFYGLGHGVNPTVGLSADEIAAAKHLYSVQATRSALATLKGQVTMNGQPVFGAVVTAENAAGNMVGGAVTRTTAAMHGYYEFPCLPPGAYKVRVTPLDPSSFDSRNYLVRGVNISFAWPDYQTAVTAFLPSGNQTVTLTANATNTLNITVTSGAPAFRITRIRTPAVEDNIYDASALPAQLTVGQSNYTVGVFSPNLPTSGATLTITGDGVTLGPVTFQANTPVGFNVISAVINVADSATPGLRTLIVQQGNNIAYANGFLDLLPRSQDYNYDGLDDQFQRRYFRSFTSPDAAPNADPDKDGFTNYQEFLAGSIPTNAASVLRLDSVVGTGAGAILRWHAAVGRKYVLTSAASVNATTWTPLGGSIKATNAFMQQLDVFSGPSRFYRLQAVP